MLGVISYNLLTSFKDSVILKNQKQHRAVEKIKIGLEAINGKLIIEHIGSKYGVCDTQISKLKQEYLESMQFGCNML